MTITAFLESAFVPSVHLNIMAIMLTFGGWVTMVMKKTQTMNLTT